MRLAPIALLAGLFLATAPADAYDFGRRVFSGGGFSGGVLRVGSRYLGRGLSRHSLRRSFAANGYGGYRTYANWRLYRNRSHRVDPYSYGRCYWRGYYRPHLYCRKYNSRYSYYKSVHSVPGVRAPGVRAPYPGGYAATRYPIGYARGGFAGGAAFFGVGHRQPIYQSRYGYRNPHTVSAGGFAGGFAGRGLAGYGGGGFGYDGGAGPYGFYDPYGYRLLPAFNFAPILMRLTTVYTIDDPAFDGDDDDANADGLPQPRTEPVGDRFLTKEN